MWSKDIAEWNEIIIKRENSFQGCILPPVLSEKWKLNFFNQVNNYAHFLKNILILNQKIFSTSAKIGLFCDIKLLFRKSVDKKLQFFTSIFHPVLLHFVEFYYNDLIPLSYIFQSQKNIKFPSLLIKLWSLKKNSLHNEKWF